MKIEKRPTTNLYPVPVVLVTSIDHDGNPNIITIAWVSTVCSMPPMVGISIRSSRYSHELMPDPGNSWSISLRLTNCKR